MKILLLSFIACFLWGYHAKSQSFFLKNYFEGIENFSLPVQASQAPGDTKTWYITEQRGKIFKITPLEKGWQKKLFLDLSDQVSQNGYETGLLGLAFHPDYINNGHLFLSFTQGQGNNLKSLIQRIEVKNNKPLLESSRTFIQISQPYENHNGGCILFGPDKFLYISFGDGGSGGDPKNYAQNCQSMLGKILRIDVDKPSNGKLYGIPQDNPFKNKDGYLPEIYAYGLRNVWRMSFDEKTGLLWAGDVGQNAFEEIDLIESGANYGWRLKEGFECFKPKAGCEQSNLKSPVYAYSQSNDDRSVTGGLVYRGQKLNNIDGLYIFGDFVTGRIWSLKLNSTGSPDVNLLLDETSKRNQISHFVQSPHQELLVLSHSGGMLMKLVEPNRP